MPSKSKVSTHPFFHLWLMLALTFGTGVIDAVGYLGLDRVFTGNMTGNIVILGMALVGADNLPVAGPAIALVLFMVGAAIAGRVLRTKDAGWSGRSTVLFSIVAVTMLGVAGALLFTTKHLPEPAALSVTGVLALGMGIQAATARHLAVKDVTTVVVTSTLAGLAADSRWAGATKQAWKRRLGAVLLIGVGATVGAAALHVHISLGLAISGVIAAAVAIAGHLGHVRE